MRHDHVAIIGGGFSGTLLAVNLLRHDGPRATLIERRAHHRGAASPMPPRIPITCSMSVPRI